MNTLLRKINKPFFCLGWKNLQHAVVFQEVCEIGIKALKNFPSMLDDGDCTNIVFIENLSHEETSDAAKSMFVNFVSDTTCAKYFTHISIRYW